MLTLYDMSSHKFPAHMGCSPHVRKIIFALNYKKLPFKIIGISSNAIESTAQSIGAPPSGTWPNGQLKYTIPFLHDSDKNQAISDSFAIAEYLDKAYPDAPRLFAEGTIEAQRELIDAREAAIMKLFPCLIPRIAGLFPEDLRATFTSRGVSLENNLSEEQEREIWENAKKAFEDAETSLGISDANYVFASLALGAMAWHPRCGYGEESEQWADMSSWGGGKLGKAADAAVGYESQILSAQ